MEFVLVSIILPTYNRGEKCVSVIKDVLNQSYQNIELILVNDGSEEYHTNFIENFLIAINDTRLKYIKHSNKGLSRSLNIGLDNAKGEYVTWISDDNKIYKNFIEKLVQPKSDFSYSSYSINTRSKINNKHQGIKDLVNGFRGMASFLWKREIMRKIGYFNLSLTTLCEDYDYMIRTFLLTTDITHIPEILIDFSVRKDTHSSMNYVEMKKMHRIVAQFYNIYLDNLSSKDNILVSKSKSDISDFGDKYAKIIIWDVKDLYFKDDTLYISDKHKELVYNILKHDINKHKIKYLYFKDNNLKDIENIKYL